MQVQSSEFRVQSSEFRVQSSEFRVQKKSLAEKRQGFTLIEMSVVLVIAGLLVGGILVALDLIEIAQGRKIMSRLQQFELAANTFKLKYDCMAGDCDKANTFSLGANGNGNKLLDGNCNTIANNGVNLTQNVLDRTPYMLRAVGECQQFWVQLSAAGFISDDISAMGSGATDIKGFYPTLHKDGHYVSAFTWGSRTVFSTGLSGLSQPYDKEIYKQPISGSQAKYVTSKVSSDTGPNISTACDGTNCTFPTELLSSKKVVPRGFLHMNPTIGTARYYSPQKTPGGGTACVTNGTSQYSYNLDGDCGLIWKID